MKIEIEGMEELQKLLRKVPREARKEVSKELDDIAGDLSGKSIDLAPVKEGDLRGSGFFETKGLSSTVGFTSVYATRQHEELDWVHPKGGQAKYLEQPFKENLQKYIKAIEKTMKKVVTK